LTVIMKWFIQLLLIGAAALAQEAAPDVFVEVYYESLCPDSKEFFANQLYPTWTKIKDIMYIDTNAFGIANFTADGEGYIFNCQHGPNECEGNMMIACGKKYIQDPELEFQWISCIMSSFYPPFAGEQCAASVGIPDYVYSPINKCVTSAERQMLLHEVGVKQGFLDPVLFWVPWIIINGEWSWEMNAAAELDLLDVVCKAYQGELPQPCLDNADEN
ncbi:unnamed protein product, partial [Meganyctiphanes norvegica]